MFFRVTLRKWSNELQPVLPMYCEKRISLLHWILSWMPFPTDCEDLMSAFQKAIPASALGVLLTFSMRKC